METLFLQYPKCSTCRKAKKWLEEQGIEFQNRDIVLQAPTSKELEDWIEQSQLPIQKFFNTSGQLYREMNMKEKIKSASKEELITILASDGKMVKRPIIVSNKGVLVGFKEDEWKAYF